MALMPASVVLIPEPCAVETGLTPGERMSSEVKLRPLRGSCSISFVWMTLAQIGG